MALIILFAIVLNKMHSIVFLVHAPTQDEVKIKDNLPCFLSQVKAHNLIFSEFLLLFKEPTDEVIIDAKLRQLGVDIFLIDTLF